MIKSHDTKYNNLIIVQFSRKLRHQIVLPSRLFVLPPQQKVFQTSLRELDLQPLLFIPVGL